MLWFLLFCLICHYSLEWMIFLFDYFKDDLYRNSFDPRNWSVNSMIASQNVNYSVSNSFSVCKKNKDRVNWKNDGF